MWPDTDLKLKNPYDFPVAIRYVVANGEAKVEMLGKKRPWDKVVFERKRHRGGRRSRPRSASTTRCPRTRPCIDQAGFDGYKLERYRRFYKDGKLVKTNKWTVNYKPVTEYIRRGTNPDPDAKMPEEKAPHHGPQDAEERHVHDGAVSAARRRATSRTGRRCRSTVAVGAVGI